MTRLLLCRAFDQLMGFFELVRPHQCHYQIDLHQFLLLARKQQVRTKLLRDALSELFPIQVAYEVLKLSRVNIIQPTKGVHVKLDKVDVR